DDLAALVDDRAARVAADDVRRADEVVRRLRVDRVLAAAEVLRQGERLAGVVLRRAGGDAADGRKRLHLLAVLLVALDRAERQPQRERRVGVLALAAQREDRLADLAVRLRLRLLDLLLVLLADLARQRVDQAGQVDHRVVRRLDRLLAAVEQRLPR